MAIRRIVTPAADNQRVPPAIRKISEDLPAKAIEVMKRISSIAIEEETSIPTDIPVKEVVGKFGLMYSTSYTLEHDASSLLQDWTEKGCPVGPIDF